MLPAPRLPGDLTRLGRQLDRTDRDRPELAAPLDGHLEAPADDGTDEPSLEVAHARDRTAVEVDHDVADTHAGGRRRTRLEHLDHLEAMPSAQSRRHRLAEGSHTADDPEEGAPDAAVHDQRVQDPSRRR